MKPFSVDFPVNLPSDSVHHFIPRRAALNRLTMGMGGIALGGLLAESGLAGGNGQPGLPHFAPKAKRVIFLFMSGGMSQLETFDYKPELTKRTGQELPESLRRGRFTLPGMSGNQASFPLVGTKKSFSRHGQAGVWISEDFPHTARVADDLCFVKTLQSDAVNHDPAMTFMATGAQLPGRPSMGAWASYGLGSLNRDLPGFVVLVSKRPVDQPLSSRLWDSGFLPTQYQGVQFRAAKDPVLFLSHPAGIGAANNERALAALRELHGLSQGPEAELHARMEQYEMAFRMQSSIPGVTDLSGEPGSVLDLYGPDVKKPGSFAANCLLARRLAQKDVRFIQVYHPGWDMHGKVVETMTTQAREVDQPAAALVADLKNHGLLNDTLVIFGTEFGRTCYSQGKIQTEPFDFGREHHRECFTFWLAGGGVKAGFSYGETDDFGFSTIENPVTVNDFHATVLKLLGIDHERFTYPFQGRDFRLTDVAGRVVEEILA